MNLAKHHEKMLVEESGIDPGFIEARGYRTVEKKAELKRLGFSEGQCGVPGLLVPVISPASGVATYQYRPDEPRIRNGKPVKYETPSGSGMALDVHPHARGKLGDPNVPLFVTEGVKKGDALASRGLCAVALLGVWNWRGSNGRGGKVALPEWEYVALNGGREVYVVFDSDVMLKPGVHAAMVRLKAFLETREAEVGIIHLPPGEGAKKQGVDDYLVAGHSVPDLLSHATTELRKPPEGDNTPGDGATQTEILLGYAEEADLFHAPDDEPYITFPVEAA